MKHDELMDYYNGVDLLNHLDSDIHRPSWDSSDILPWMPRAPFVPNEEPAAILVAYNYEQLKSYRLQSQPYIVRAHYDVVQQMLEDGIMKKHERDYQEWLTWVEANL